MSYFMVSGLGPGPQSWASGFTTCTPITNNTRIPTRRRNRERRVGKFLLVALLRDMAGAALGRTAGHDVAELLSSAELKSVRAGEGEDALDANVIVVNH